MVEVLRFAADGFGNLVVTLLVMMVGGLSVGIALAPLSGRSTRVPPK